MSSTFPALRLGLLISSVAALSATAAAQVSLSFEPPTYNGSAAGTVVTGQDAWYNPVAGSADGVIMTYAGNTYGIPANPTGGAQVLVCRKSNLNFARAQRDFPWGDGLNGCWTMCFDLLGKFVVDETSDPNGPGLNNLGSVSIQPYPTNGAILLAFWGDPLDPNFAGEDSWNLGILGYDETGGGGGAVTGAITYFPNSQFVNIPQDQWMRICVDVDLDVNALTGIEISQLGSADVDRYEASLPADPFYLGAGGSTQIGPITGARLFGGGGAGGPDGSGNTLAMDNFSVAACGGTNPCPCPGDFNNDNSVGLSDLTAFLASFGGAPSNPCMDTNGDNAIGLADLTEFLSNFGSTCN